MEKIKNIPLPGLRNIKTGISVVICLLCYHFIGREGVMLAAVAAIICMQDSVEKSITLGINRVRGTVFGGLLATAFVLLGVSQAPFIVFLGCSFFGIVFYIYICNLMDIKQSITIGCLVFLMILVDAEKAAEPLSYCLNRTLDTLVGIVIANMVNRFMFRPTPERTAGKEGSLPMKIKYDIIRADHFKNSTWSGGTTTELFIYPEDSIYADRDFDFRVSTATIDLEHSHFTKLPGYKRYIMLLEGKMHLYHEGYHDIDLDLFEQDCFKGGWETKSYGKCRDFNLMAKEGFSGGLEAVKTGFEYSIDSGDYNGIYIVRDNVSLILSWGDQEESQLLHQGDYMSFTPADGGNGSCRLRFSGEGMAEEETVAVKVKCYRD